MGGCSSTHCTQLASCSNGQTNLEQDLEKEITNTNISSRTAAVSSRNFSSNELPDSRSELVKIQEEPNKSKEEEKKKISLQIYDVAQEFQEENCLDEPTSRNKINILRFGHQNTDSNSPNESSSVYTLKGTNFNQQDGKENTEKYEFRETQGIFQKLEQEEEQSVGKCKNILTFIRESDEKKIEIKDKKTDLIEFVRQNRPVNKINFRESSNNIIEQLKEENNNKFSDFISNNLDDLNGRKKNTVINLHEKVKESSPSNNLTKYENSILHVENNDNNEEQLSFLRESAPMLLENETKDTKKRFMNDSESTERESYIDSMKEENIEEKIFSEEDPLILIAERLSVGTAVASNNRISSEFYSENTISFHPSDRSPDNGSEIETISSENTINDKYFSSSINRPKSGTLHDLMQGKKINKFRRKPVIDNYEDNDGLKVINNYHFIRLLGEGSMCRVELAFKQTESNIESMTPYVEDDDSNLFAIKIANNNMLKSYSMLGSRSPESSIFEKEINIMKKLNHPNIVSLHEVIEDKENGKLYLVMEYMSLGAIMSPEYFKEIWLERDPQRYLFNFEENGRCKNKNRLPKCLHPDEALKYFRDIALALDYLHNVVGVIHKDIKPENLLVSKNDVLKLSDFGISSILNEKKKKTRPKSVDKIRTQPITEKDLNKEQQPHAMGTLPYMAPESFEPTELPFEKGKPADIWATGVTLYQLSFGELPFSATKNDDLQKIIREKPVVFPTEHICPPEQIDFISRCLEKDPIRRITASEMLVHPWLTENGKAELKNICSKHNFRMDDSKDSVTDTNRKSYAASLESLHDHLSQNSYVEKSRTEKSHAIMENV